METTGTPELAPDERRNIERLGRTLGRMVANWIAGGRALGIPPGAGIAANRARNALAAKDRPHFVPALTEAVRRGWVIRQQGSDRLHPGVPVPGESRLGLVAELDAAGAYTT